MEKIRFSLLIFVNFYPSIFKFFRSLTENNILQSRRRLIQVDVAPHNYIADKYIYTKGRKIQYSLKNQ